MSEQQEHTDFEADQGGGEPTVGDLLRREREFRGESLSDVAHALKLSPRQVEALELERFDLLPGPAFVRGFMRNYARYVGIDVEARIASLTFGESAQGARLAPVTNATGDMPSGGGGRNTLKPAMIVIAGMLLVLAAGWYFDWFQVVEEDAGRPLAIGEPDVGVGALPSPPRFARDEAQSTVVMPQLAPELEPTVDATRLADEETAPLLDGLESDVTATMPSALEGAEAERVAEAEELAEEGAPLASAVVDEPSVETGRLVFSLSGESWIQVRDGEGAALFTGTGTAGTTRTVQGKAPFSIVVGNAGLVSLEYDGEPVDLAPHIRSGGVARMTLR